MRARDSQRLKFWRATDVIDPLGQSLTRAQARRILLTMHERMFLKRRYSTSVRRKWDVVDHKKRGTGDAGYWSISLYDGDLYMNRIVYLAARAIWWRLPVNGRMAWYGPEYAKLVLEMTQVLMGKAAADLLKESYRAHNVRWKEKKKVVVTEAMLERLTRARELANEA